MSSYIRRKMRPSHPQFAVMRLLVLLFLAPLATEGSLLVAIRKVLNYYYHQDVTDDFLFGVILAEGQLNAVKSVYSDIQDNVDMLLETCDKIIENNPRFYITEDSVNRVKKSLGLLKTLDVVRLQPTLKLPSYKLEENLQYGSPSMFNSTYCVLEAMMAEQISDLCQAQMRDTRARGYTLSHQALFFSLASSMLPLPFIQNLIQQKCEKMLYEVIYAWKKGLSEDLQDLAIEEVAVCGMSKYQEFLIKPILNNIVSLQHKEGCFSLAKEGPLSKCDEHLSAVSLLALTNFLYAEGESQHNVL